MLLLCLVSVLNKLTIYCIIEGIPYQVMGVTVEILTELLIKKKSTNPRGNHSGALWMRCIYGEVMELNERLHKDIAAKDKSLESMIACLQKLA